MTKDEIIKTYQILIKQFLEHPDEASQGDILYFKYALAVDPTCNLMTVEEKIETIQLMNEVKMDVDIRVIN